jgi:hypothetical protein
MTTQPDRERSSHERAQKLFILGGKAVVEPQQPASRLRLIVFALITVSLTIIGSLILAEIVLWFLPVQSGLRSQPVDAENPVFHFMPGREVTFSRGWNFDMVNRRRVNNAGWVNDQDYRKDHETPLIAIIGDSYVEAIMVPYAETLYGRLAQKLQGRVRVYSFGASGAPLSQYLVWAGHAVREYGARAVIINVVGNDFDESHVAYNTGPGWWVYVPGPDGNLHLRLIEYRPGWLRSIVYNSSLARYIFFNLQFWITWNEIRSFFLGSPALAAPRYAGNTAAEASPLRVQTSLAAINAVFRDLPAMVGLPPDRVLFTLDGFRYPEVAAAGAGTYFDLMRRAFRSKALSLGYEVIDLDSVFFDQYAAHGQRFEYPHDGHWNEIGHAVAVKALLASKLAARLLDQP